MTPLLLGSAQQRILHLFRSGKVLSVYEVMQAFRESEHAITYKNAHKTVKGLEARHLLKQAKGFNKPSKLKTAIYYELDYAGMAELIQSYEHQMLQLRKLFA